MCGGLVLIGLTAGAAPLEGVSLTWEAAAGCGSEAAVYERLAEALGPEWSSPTPVLARARLTPVGQIWQLEFSAVMEGAESRRELAVDSCDAAEVATALFTLLAVAPDFVEKLDTRLLNAHEGRGSPDTQGSPPTAKPGPPGALKRTPQPGPKTTSPSTHEVRGFIGLGGMVQTGVIADFGQGPEVRAGAEVGRLRLVARGYWLSPQRSGLEEPAGASVEMSLLGAGLEVALALRGPQLAWGPYLGIDANLASARAFGITSPESANTSWAAAGGGLWLDWPVSERLAINACVGVAAPLHRPTFSIGGLGTVRRPSPIEAKLGLGLSLELSSRN